MIFTQTFCYHFDATGHTIALTDMAGTVVNSYAYEPFGQILAEQETIAQPFKFVGQYGVMAEPSGLYYMRARYYDPSVGRFISEDPIGFAGGDVNLYAYVSNEPLNAIDPFGLMTESQRQAIIANWTAAGSGLGAMLGFLGGGGAGVFAGPGAPVAVPAGAYAGAVSGAAIGGTAGAGIGIYLANMMDDDRPSFEKMRRGDNTAKNSQFRDACKKIGKDLGKKLSDDQIRQLHDYITKQGYEGMQDIYKAGMELFNK